MFSLPFASSTYDVMNIFVDVIFSTYLYMDENEYIKLHVLELLNKFHYWKRIFCVRIENIEGVTYILKSFIYINMLFGELTGANRRSVYRLKSRNVSIVIKMNR